MSKYVPPGVSPLPWPPGMMPGYRDREFARHAANAYPRLVDALERVTSEMGHWAEDLGINQDDVDELADARALLRECEEAAR